MAREPIKTMLVRRPHRMASLSAVEMTCGNVPQIKFVTAPITLELMLAAPAQMSLGNLHRVRISASQVSQHSEMFRSFEARLSYILPAIPR